MNAFHPEVQDFMLDLISEILFSYPTIDGIQGDDRLPALPSTAGYDEYTIQLFKKEHGGKIPPENHYDQEWVIWRSNQLNNFMRKFSTLIKSKGKY